MVASVPMLLDGEGRDGDRAGMDGQAVRLGERLAGVPWQGGDQVGAGENGAKAEKARQAQHHAPLHPGLCKRCLQQLLAGAGDDA